jgi:two-component system, cell cycle response regulator
LNILVIDDNPSHLKLAHLVLSAAGYAVNDAGAAEQAGAAIHSDKPDLILLDLELPGMDGLALVQKLKADPETRDIHIVAVTSYPERYPKGQLLAAGCAAYVTKPINTRTLPGELESLIK